MKKLLAAILTLTSAAWLCGADSVQVSFRSTTYNGQYAPNNVVAVWVTTGGGSFVKTIGRWAAEQRGQLVTWVNAAGSSDVDAVMGATRSNHTALLTVTWDLKNRAGQVMADGAYTIHLECTESSGGQGQDLTTLAFTKNGVAQTINYPNSGGFTNLTLVYTVTTPVPAMNVKGNGVTIATGDATPAVADGTDFGSALVAGGTVAHAFTIENTGTAALTVAPPTFSGTNAADFAVTVAPSSPVAAGGATTFQVTFTPGGLGARPATVNIANNDATKNPYTFAIRGTGTAPAINLKGGGVSIANGDTTPALADLTDFGNAVVGTGTVTRTFTVENLGTGPLTVSGPALSGTNAADFAVTAAPASPVAAGASTTFQVTFTPGGLGVRPASVSLANSDSAKNPYTFAIQGTGVAAPAPSMNVRGNNVSISDGASAPAAADFTDFGNAVLAGTPVVRTYLIENAGNAALTVAVPTFSGTNAGDFTVTANPAASVAAGGTTSFQVRFAPGALGLRQARLNIANNDTPRNPYDFAIQGTGVAALLPTANVRGNGLTIPDGSSTPFTTDGTDFGAAHLVGASVVHTFTIENTGDATLTVGAPTIGGAAAGDFSVTANPATSVAAGGATTFQVTFDPSALGVRQATVSFANNDAARNPYDFAIQGTGVNTPPVAVATATPNPTVVGKVVTLSAAGSADPDGAPAPLTYSWVSTAWPAGGTAPTLSAPDAVETTFTAASEGSYTFSLTVSDGAASGTASLDVVVGSVLTLTLTLPAQVTAGATAQGAIHLSRVLNAGETLVVTLASGDPAALTVASPVTIATGQSANCRLTGVTAGPGLVKVTATAPDANGGTATTTVVRPAKVRQPAKPPFDPNRYEASCRLGDARSGGMLWPLGLALLAVLCRRRTTADATPGAAAGARRTS